MLEIVQSVIQAFLMRLTWFANALMHLNCLCFVQFLSRQLDRTEQARIRSFLLQQYASYRLQKNAYWPASVAAAVCMYVHACFVLCLKSFRKAESRLDFELPRPTGPVQSALATNSPITTTHCSVPIYSIPIRLQCIQCLHNNSVPDYYYCIIVLCDLGKQISLLCYLLLCESYIPGYHQKKPLSSGQHHFIE